MTDADTKAAITALAHRISARDAAMRDGAEYADPEPFAQEFIAAMQGYGWRHMAALAKPKAAAVEVVTTGSRGEALTALRTQLDELNAAKKAAREAGAA